MEFCEICQKQMKKGKLNFHLKSKFHLKNEMKMKKSTENVEHENQDEVETRDEEIDEDEDEEETKCNEVSTQTDEYLSDFNNIQYITKFKKINQRKLRRIMLLFYMTLSKKALRNNREFCDLIRLLSIKYNTFQNVSPEIQLAIIVASTSYITIMTNRQKKKMLEDQLKNQNM